MEYSNGILVQSGTDSGGIFQWNIPLNGTEFNSICWLFATMMFFANFHTIEIRSTIDKNVVPYQNSTQKMRTINLCYYSYKLQRTSCVFFVFCVFCVSSSSWWDDVKKEVMMHTTKILQQSLHHTTSSLWWCAPNKTIQH